jgi:hypothetical protein
MISPGYSYQKAPDQQHFLKRSRTTELFSQDSGQSEARVAVQPVAAVPGVPDGQARVSMHALGEPHVQRLRLAAPLLFAAGGLCVELPGV